MNEEEIKTALLEKARKAGYLTELEVAEIFRKHGFRLELNKYYNDIDEEKGREIDLIAEYSRKTDTDEDNYLEMIFKFVVEIKRSEKPWVFTSFLADDFYENEDPFFRLNSENFDKLKLIAPFIEFLGKIENERLGRNFSVIDPFNPNGKNDNDQPIMNALSSVAKAFYEEHFSNSYIRSEGSSLSEKIFEYHELLVVVDAPIYEIFIENGKDNIRKVSELLVSFNYKSPRYDETQVYIVRVLGKEHLDEFLRGRTEAFKKISEDVLKKEGDGKTFDE